MHRGTSKHHTRQAMMNKQMTSLKTKLPSIQLQLPDQTTTINKVPLTSIFQNKKGIMIAVKSLIHETQPKTTLQYANMITYATSCTLNPHIRHNELYLSTKWRVRKCYLNNKTVFIDHKHAINNSHIQKIRDMLVQILTPQARTAVVALLDCKDRLKKMQHHH